jgi:hypothetical protein
MPSRSLLVDGVHWDVYDVVAPMEPRRPLTPLVAAMTGQQTIMEAWLCFESASEKRRLRPIPEGWEEETNEGLAELLAAATVVPKRG